MKTTNIKTTFNKIVYHYSQIVKLHTGYRINSIPLLLFILSISLGSIFLRIDVFEELRLPTLVLNVIFLFGLLNLIFLQFNFGCRLTLTLGKGLPFFARELRLNKIPFIRYYFIGFILYNITFSFFR